MDAVHLETGRTRKTACGWYTMWSAVSTETLCLSRCAPSSSPSSASSTKKEYGRRSSLASSPLSSVSSCAGVTSCGRSSCGPAARTERERGCTGSTCRQRWDSCAEPAGP